MSTQIPTDSNSKSVHVLLQDEIGRLLLCTRSKTKETYPNLITSSAGGRVEDDENFLEAAERELYEELGIKEIPLLEYGIFTVNNTQEHTLHHLFVGVIQSNTALTIDAQEIAIAEWYFVDEIKKSIKDTPTAFADPFLLAFSVYQESLLYVLDFDHTLFNWYQCKQELQEYLYTEHRIDSDSFSQAKKVAEEHALYNIFSHLDQLAIQKKIDRILLRNALDTFMKGAERFIYSDAPPLLQTLKRSPHTTLLLSYGDQENQEFFIQTTGITDYVDATHIVAEKKQKVAVIRSLARNRNGSTISVNDDPEESILINETIPFMYNNLVIERTGAKFTHIPTRKSYYKILSLKEVTIPL